MASLKEQAQQGISNHDYREEVSGQPGVKDGWGLNTNARKLNPPKKRAR